MFHSSYARMQCLTLAKYVSFKLKKKFLSLLSIEHFSNSLLAYACSLSQIIDGQQSSFLDSGGFLLAVLHTIVVQCSPDSGFMNADIHQCKRGL